jgi:hypothetical protein
LYSTSQHIPASRAPWSKNPKKSGKIGDHRQKTRDAWGKAIWGVAADMEITGVSELRNQLAQSPAVRNRISSHLVFRATQLATAGYGNSDFS